MLGSAGNLVGSVGGGIAGAIGGYFAAKEQRKLAEQVSASIQYGTGKAEAATARKVGTIMSTPEYLKATEFVRGIYGMQSGPNMGQELLDTVTAAYGWDVYNDPTFQYKLMEERFGRNAGMSSEENQIFGAAAGGIRQNVLPGLADRIQTLQSEGATMEGGERYDPRNELGNLQDSYAENAGVANLYASMSDAFEGAEGGGPVDSLTKDLIKGIRQAQSTRGLYNSQVGAGAEGSGLAAFKARMQLEALPYMFQLAEAPVEYGHRYMDQELQKEIFRHTGGKAVYGQVSPFVNPGLGTTAGALQGAAAGMAAGGAAGKNVGLTLQDIVNQQDMNKPNQPTLEPVRRPTYEPRSGSQVAAFKSGQFQSAYY